MTLNEMIFKRKSCRSFTGVPVDAAIANHQGFSLSVCNCRFSIRFQLINPYRSLTRNITKQMITER